MTLNNLSLLQITLASPGATAFHIGSWSVRWYGVFIAIAFLVAYALAEKLASQNNLDLNCFNDLIFFILIVSIVFARLWFVFLSWDYFSDHLIEIPMIWLGGQSIHGGILGAILAAFFYSKIKKVSFYNYMDVIAVITPLSQAIGRWGNFFNNEAFGKPVQSWFLKLYIPPDFRPEQFINNKYFHPTFLYESILDLVLFLFLYKKFSTWKEKPGKIFWIYLLGYSIIRFFLEFIRVDSLYLFDHIASAHVISAIIIVVSIVMMFRNRR